MTLDNHFHHTLMAEPFQHYDIIVRTDGATDEVVQLCERLGMKVHRHFRILPGLSATGKGSDVLRLARNPHVLHIECDGKVFAL